MSQRFTPDLEGDADTRPDGTKGFPVIYRDSDGQICGRAFIPQGHNPAVPDHVDISNSGVVSWDELEKVETYDTYTEAE